MKQSLHVAVSYHETVSSEIYCVVVTVTESDLLRGWGREKGDWIITIPHSSKKIKTEPEMPELRYLTDLRQKLTSDKTRVNQREECG